MKGQNRNVAVARAAANERRTKTLKVEYNNRDKVNSFVDRRFGEDDEDLVRSSEHRNVISALHFVVIYPKCDSMRVFLLVWVKTSLTW